MVNTSRDKQRTWLIQVEVRTWLIQEDGYKYKQEHG